MGRLVTFFVILCIPLLTIVSAQTNCLTTADNNPCDGTVSLAELTTHINAWYQCSACVPDIFNALQAYFRIPFCGDWSCNATVGEDCSSCSNDCGNCTASQPNASFPQDYIAYWKFENDLTDSGGYGNDGSCVNCPAYVAGQVGQAVGFDGIDDYVVVNKSGSPLDITGDEVTISFWVNGSFGSLTKHLAGIGESDASENWKAQYLFFYRSGPVVEFIVDTPTSHNILQSSTPFNSGEWVHVAGVYDGSNMYVYLNGNLENTQALTGNLYSNKLDFSVGANAANGGMPFSGSIDELMIFNRSLSIAEIQQIYFAQSGIACLNDTGCSSHGSFCDPGTGMPYACTLNATDGCLDRTDGAACSTGEVCTGGTCIPDPCYGIGQCSDYNDSANCSADGCGVGGFLGCDWNSSSGACEKVVFTYSGNWTPPIGIPYPSFGIDETHYMYQLQSGEDCTTNPEKCYDFGSGLQPYKDAGNGPYTHYVDNSVACNDNYAGGYGNSSNPRCSIPTTLAEGSVIEIHGGPYNPTYIIISAAGTQQKPIFVRGTDFNNKPIVRPTEFRPLGSYLIVENIDFFGITEITILPPSDHVSLRHCEMHNSVPTSQSTALTVTSWNTGSPNANQDIVIYNNHIYDRGVYQQGVDDDSTGIVVGARSNNIWVVDNEIFDTTGGGVVINAGNAADRQLMQATNHIYVGRNIAYDLWQSGFGLKRAVDVVFSENIAFNIFARYQADNFTIDSPSKGFSFQYGPERTWFLFNKVYDCENGFFSASASGMTGGEIYMIGNLIYGIQTNGDDQGIWRQGVGFSLTDDENASKFMINNVLHNAGAGILNPRGTGPMYILNNILSNITDEHIWIDSSVRSSISSVDNTVFDETARILWGGSTYRDVSSMQSAFGECIGCIEADPQFIDPDNLNFSLSSGSPAIDSGIESSVYGTFFSLYGIDIKKDIEGRTRPLDGDNNGTAEWDIGPYEY